MIVSLFKTRRGVDPEAEVISRRLRQAGFRCSLRIERVLRIEAPSFDERAVGALGNLFANPVLESVGTVSALKPGDAPIREVGYKPAWTDPEWNSLAEVAGSWGLKTLDWARLARRYQFSGLDDQAADAAVSHLCNPQVELVSNDSPDWRTLRPQGTASPTVFYPVDTMTFDELGELKQILADRRLFLPDEQVEAIWRFYSSNEREASDAELEMIAAFWSDHCRHTTWKALGLMQRLMKATAGIAHPLVLLAFTDNSGTMRFYGGYVLTIKGETHISPTFGADPYGGIMTKHGGVIRDAIFTGQGAWPWVGTTIMGIADPRLAADQVPQGAFHPLKVLRESVRGTHDYTNPMGIPMGWSEYRLHPRNWKGFALGHSLGVIPEHRALKGRPEEGDFVVLIGGHTGLDGIHGAVVSSGAMTHETSVRDAAHVQIGMPIEERKFMEAIPVLRDSYCIRACTDCGAAGLASAVGELGEDVGVWLNLAWVRLKCAGMADWEILLSESQERGVLAVPPERLELALSILADYQVSASVIGYFDGSNHFSAVNDPSIEQDEWVKSPTTILNAALWSVTLPYSFLSGECPLPSITVAPPPFKPEQAYETALPIPASQEEWKSLIERHLGHFDIADQSLIAHRYDQTVQGNTVVPYIGGEHDNMPDEIFVATPVPGMPYGAGIASAWNQRYGDLDPEGLGRLMLVQAVTKLVAAGFAPDDITLCANVYSPSVLNSPDSAWRLQTMVNAYIGATKQVGIPVISGKDSSSGTFICDGQRIDAPLTLHMLATGRMPDASRVIPKAFPADVSLYLFTPGVRSYELGGSVLFDHLGRKDGSVTPVNLYDVGAGWARYHSLSKRVEIRCRSVVSEGGLIRRLFEMSLGRRYGAKISLGDNCPLSLLFSELHAGIVFGVSHDDQSACEKALGVNLRYLGETSTEHRLMVLSQGSNVLLDTSIDSLGQRWSSTVREVL